MGKWHNEEGEHEQSISDEQLKIDLRDLRAVDKLMKEGKITAEQHRQALNIIRPAENGEEGLGDMWTHNAEWHAHKEKKKRGRPRNEDQQLG
jgi:hypothetical protein